MELFNCILEKSGYNLNKYIKGRSLSIPDSDAELISSDIKKFVSAITEELKRIENQNEFWESFCKLDDSENINKFVEWLHNYTDSMLEPYRDAGFLRHLDSEVFENKSKYCLENFILKDIGKRENNQESEIFILKRILLTFIDMVVVNNYSKENALESMKKMFGIDERHCTIWWDMVQEKEERLWRVMLMRKCDRIDRKLEYLIDEIEEVEMKFNNL